MFKVLVPEYVFAGMNSDDQAQYNVRWKVVGIAPNMQEAKKITNYPVLQAV